MKEHKNFTFFSIFAEDSIDTLDIFYGVGGVWGQGSLRVTSDAVQCCIYHHKVNGMFWYVDFEQSDTKLTPVIISKSGMIVSTHRNSGRQVMYSVRIRVPAELVAY